MAQICLRHSQTHMWRLRSQRLEPSLAGQDGFSKQCPIGRCVPLWGGLSAGGFAAKLTKGEWVNVMKSGRLVSALKSLDPVKADGPWHLLCDNERFLAARQRQDEYRKVNVRLWRIPPKSPDLNPIERFWGYLKKRLRKMDLN